MSEIRKDYFSDRIVLIAAAQAQEHLDTETQGLCRLCPGNEHLTPPADMVLVESGGTLIRLMDSDTDTVKDWVVRIYPTKEAIVQRDPVPTYGDPPLYSEPGFGFHYTLVATPNHSDTFGRIGVDQWVNILSTIQDKIRWLYAQKKVAYVLAYLDYPGAGCAYHPKIDIVTLPRLPTLMEVESEAVQRSMYEFGVCPMCRIISLESGGPRQIMRTDSHVAFVPWAARRPYEYWIFPLAHQLNFSKVSQRDIRDLALILRSTLGGLEQILGDIGYCLAFHLSSEKKTTKQIHCHIEVYPRAWTQAALELGWGISVSGVGAEKAAEILGAICKRELAQAVGAA